MWISINMRKISLLHLFMFQTQSVLESHHQIGHTQFFILSSQKKFDYLLICVNLYQHAKNQVSPSVYSWDTQSESRDLIRYTHILTMPNQNTLPATFNFYEFASTCKKWDSFIHLLWRNSWFQNPAIWLA